MWEFSLNFKSENFELAKFAYNSLREMAGNIFVTSTENNGIISVLIAADEAEQCRTKMVVSSLITEIVCTKFKTDFLNCSLYLPMQDESGINAFKKALLNFDRETDKYIVKRMLDLSGGMLFVESFFSFKLRDLHEKWEELVMLANENRDYLVSRENFIDLLKFLVDNLDICEGEIGIIKENDGYRIINCENSFYINKVISEDRVVSSVIDLSPQKICLYFHDSSNAINLLRRVFDERVSIQNEEKVVKRFKV